MPRGVYDRSKMKKKAAKSEASAAEAPKAKRKYTKRAQQIGAPEVGGVGQIANFSDTLFKLRELAALKAGGISGLDSIIGKLVKKLEIEYDDSTKAVEAAPQPKNGKAAKAVAEEKSQTALPAPVPFIPQTPASPA